MAGLIALIGALPLATARWYLAPTLLVPLAVVIWGWRSGTDADQSGLRPRGVLGGRRIPWTEIVELGGDERGRAQARLANGRIAPLPAVRVTDLPRLVAAGGRELDAPGQ